MDDRQYIVAIEIANSCISGIAAVTDPLTRNTSLLGGIGEEPVSDCVRYGNIVNLEEVKDKVMTIIQDIERNARLAEPHTVAAAFVGISGRSLHSETVVIEKTINDFQQVNETLIAKINREAAEDFPDLDVVAIIPRSYEIDNKTVMNPVGAIGSRFKATLNVIVCKKTIERSLRTVFDGLHLEMHPLITPLAVGDYVLTAEERRQGCMLVDIGAETTTTVIYKGDRLVYLNVLPMGSRNITRDLMTLNLSEDLAESIKKKYGDAMPEPGSASQIDVAGVNADDITNYVRMRAEEIVENISNQITLASLTSEQLPGGIIAVGRGMKMHGMTKLLEERTKLSVRKGVIPEAGSHTELNDRIQLMSLLNAASKQIAEGQSCMVPQKAPEPEVEDEDEEKPEQKEQQPKKKKRGFFKRIADSLSDKIEKGMED